MKKFILICCICFLGNYCKSQIIYQHTSSETIYEFLDEMADLQLINLNTSVKPYSRALIAELVYSLDAAALNKRQLQELEFFKKDYIKEVHRDSLVQFQSNKFLSEKHFFTKSDLKRRDVFFYENGFTQFSINPILGVDYNISANSFQRRFGGEVKAYLGEKWGVYFNFRDVAENISLTNPDFVNQYPGGVARVISNDYSEVRGGITYDWGWGSIGLIKDQFIWGNSQNGSIIFSGKNPSTPQIKIDIKPTEWFEFHYFHAWLNSEVIDSTRTYNLPTGAVREVFQPKYLASNIFILKPFKNTYFGFGNSIIYSDIPIHPSYLLPFLFYRSVDHQLSGQDNRSGQNGQIFFDVSIREIKGVHLYSTLFIDEIRLSSISDRERQRNQLSFKTGIRVSNILNSNTTFIAEFTRANPFVYRHFVPSTTFESNQFNIGHYLRDNAREIYLAVVSKPIPRLSLQAYYLDISKGEEIPFSSGASGGVEGAPFLENIIFTQQEFGLKVNYELLHDVNINAELKRVSITDDTRQLVPSFMVGNNTFFTISTNINF